MNARRQTHVYVMEQGMRKDIVNDYDLNVAFFEILSEPKACRTVGLDSVEV